MKAYKVWCNDGDHGQVIRFAERGRDVGRYLDCACGWIELHVTRAPEFDKYAPGPVTLRQYLAEGWHWECSGCCRLVYEDDNPVIIRHHVYHSGDCVQADWDNHQRWHEKGDRLHISLKQHLAAIKRWLKKHSTTSAARVK